MKFIIYIKYAIFRRIARYRGAIIGRDTILPFKLAINANSNLTVGEDTIIGENVTFDLRGQIRIGNHVIVNDRVEIIRVSHYIDNDTLFTTRYYPELVIEDYSWLATASRILPSCTKVSSGSIISAFAVVVKNTEPMGVYSGNPAKLIRHHNSSFHDLVVVFLKGGDFRYYLQVLNHVVFKR